MLKTSFLGIFTDGRSMAVFTCGILLLLVGCGGDQPDTPTVQPDSQTPVIEVPTDPLTPSSSGDTDQPGDNQSQVDGITPLTFTATDEGSFASASGTRTGAEPNRYLLTGEAGQLLTVVLVGEPNIGFNLFQNDTIIPIDRSDAGRREWTIPANGDYEFRLFNGTVGSDFSFEATLSNSPTVADGNDAEEIEGGVDGKTGITTLDEAVSLNPWGETTATLNLESNGESNGESNNEGWVTITGIDLVQNGTTRQRLDIRTDGLVFYNEGTFIAEDINLDGFTDLRLVRLTPAGPNISHFYWLYDSASDSFVQNISYEQLISPEFVGDGQIKTFYRGSATQYTFGRFQVTDAGPIPVGRQDCEFIQQDDGSMIIRNTGYAVDDTGVETVVFEENSEGDCLPYKATP